MVIDTIRRGSTNRDESLETRVTSTTAEGSRSQEGRAGEVPQWERSCYNPRSPHIHGGSPWRERCRRRRRQHLSPCCLGHSPNSLSEGCLRNRQEPVRSVTNIFTVEYGLCAWCADSLLIG